VAQNIVEGHTEHQKWAAQKPIVEKFHKKHMKDNPYASNQTHKQFLSYCKPISSFYHITSIYDVMNYQFTNLLCSR